MFSRYLDKYVVVQFTIIFAWLLASPFFQIHMSFGMHLLGLLLFCLGMGVMCIACIKLGEAFTPAVTPIANSHLVITGVYAYVRHPIYSGVIFLTLGWSIMCGSLLSLLFAVILGLFFAYKARKEEQLLNAKYPEYAEYRAHVTSRLIPFLY